MTLTTVPAQIARLAKVFDSKPMSREKFAEYARDLADMPPGLLEEAVTNLIRRQTEPWMPPIGMIREACAEVALLLPSAHDALAAVDATLGWAHEDALERSERPPSLHPLVRQALSLTGGTAAFRASEQPSITRAQFAKTYRELRAAEILNAQLASALTSSVSRVLDG